MPADYSLGPSRHRQREAGRERRQSRQSQKGRSDMRQTITSLSSHRRRRHSLGTREILYGPLLLNLVSVHRRSKPIGPRFSYCPVFLHPRGSLFPPAPISYSVSFRNRVDSNEDVSFFPSFLIRSRPSSIILDEYHSRNESRKHRSRRVAKVHRGFAKLHGSELRFEVENGIFRDSVANKDTFCEVPRVPNNLSSKTTVIICSQGSLSCWLKRTACLFAGKHG